MSTVYLAGPTPGTPFINGIYTRAQVALEQAGHTVINPTQFTNHGEPCSRNAYKRLGILRLSLDTEIVCTIHGAEQHIIRTAHQLGIPVKTLHQLTTKAATK